MSDNQNVFEYLPVDSFDELKQMIEDREVTIGVRKDLALECARKGVLLSQRTIKTAQRLVQIPFITTFILIAYVLFLGKWELLLTIPVFFIGFFGLHPNLLDTLGVRKLASLVLIVGIIVGAYNQTPWLIFLSAILLINHFSQSMVYSVSINEIKKQASESKDSFEKFWTHELISIHMKDGSCFYQDFRQESDGKFIQYKSDDTKVSSGRPSEEEMKEYLNSNSEFFRGMLLSSSKYWRDVIGITNNFKAEEGIKVDDQFSSKNFTSECLCYGYALTFIGLLKEAGEQRYSNFGILLDLGLQGKAIDLIMENEKLVMNSSSEDSIDNIKDQSIDRLVDAGVIVGNYFDAEENKENNPEGLLSDYFIEQVRLDTAGSPLPYELRKKISSLTKEVIDNLANG